MEQFCHSQQGRSGCVQNCFQDCAVVTSGGTQTYFRECAKTGKAEILEKVEEHVCIRAQEVM